MTATKHTPELTAPVEDYLKVIFELETTGRAVGTNEIAAQLEIAAPSVTAMVRRLADHGLIKYERYRGARLTEAGRRAALRTIRRHRVIEAYLTAALGYPWDRVHEEAERLEHAASDELIDRMAAAIGEPTTDPHGAPIPTREGELRERALVPLSSLAEGEEARVERVGDQNADRLRYLAELGIVPGVRVQVTERDPFEGPITLLVEDERRTIGAALAGGVFVARAAAGR